MLFRYLRQMPIEILLVAAAITIPQLASSAEFYGPVNLLKTMPTPFSPPIVKATGEILLPSFKDGRQANRLGLPINLSNASSFRQDKDRDSLRGTPISIDNIGPQPINRSLKQRLITSRLYLPGRMVLGKSATFSISGPPGSFMAMAMADKDKGAKPVYGHDLHLGADRKVVAIGKIPPSGLLTFAIETPIQGDLVGQYLYFEAATWKKDDFSDIDVATPVSSEEQEGIYNGVLIAKESESQKGIKIVPDAAVPLQQRERPTGSTLDSGRL